MANEPKIIQEDTNQNPYDLLSDKDKQIVEWALVNMPRHMIAIKTKRSYQTVKEWFCKGGRLHGPYHYMLKERLKEFRSNRKKVDQILQEGAVESASGLRIDARRAGMIGNISRRDLLDRAGYRAPDKVEVDEKTPTKVVVHFNWPNEKESKQDNS